MATIYQAKKPVTANDISNVFPKVHPKVGIAKKSENLNGFVATYNDYADYFAIDTALEVAHFFAQVGHECDQFNAFSEYADGSAYEGRKDLGNTQPGDGPRFKGHGALQTTGRINHQKANVELLKLPFLTTEEKALFANDGLLRNPLLLTVPKWAALSAMIYWINKDLNSLCVPDDQQVIIKRYDGTKWYNYTCSPIEGITRKINGGINGLEERKILYQKMKSIIR